MVTCNCTYIYMFYILFSFFQASWLKKWKLVGNAKNIKKNKNCQQLIAAYKVFYQQTGYCTLAIGVVDMY